MPKSISEIVEQVKTKLSGELQKNTLDFIEYMNETFGWNHLGQAICFLTVDRNRLTIYFGHQSIICCTYDFDYSPINDELKEFTWSNVNVCNCHRGNLPVGFTVQTNPCRQGDNIIFGKKFDNLCNCPIGFTNPDAETFEKIKELVEAWKLCIAELKGSEYYKQKLAEQEVAILKKEALIRENEYTLRPLLNELEATFQRGKTVDVDLATMEKRGDFELNYKSGLMEIKMDGDMNSMATTQKFTAPLKIELRAKTDSTNIRLKYAKGLLIFNWESNPAELRTADITIGRGHGYKERGKVPINEFVDIEWIICKELMAVKVNGELRHVGNHYDYINPFRENPKLNISSEIIVAAAQGSTMTVEKLQVTEI